MVVDEAGEDDLFGDVWGPALGDELVFESGESFDDEGGLFEEVLEFGDGFGGGWLVGHGCPLVSVSSAWVRVGQAARRVCRWLWRSACHWSVAASSVAVPVAA